MTWRSLARYLPLSKIRLYTLWNKSRQVAGVSHGICPFKHMSCAPHHIVSWPIANKFVRRLLSRNYANILPIGPQPVLRSDNSRNMATTYLNSIFMIKLYTMLIFSEPVHWLRCDCFEGSEYRVLTKPTQKTISLNDIEGIIFYVFLSLIEGLGSTVERIGCSNFCFLGCKRFGMLF